MYYEHEEVRNRPWIDTEKFIDVHQVKFTGFRCPRPLFKFEHANFPDYLMEVIKSQEKTYAKPTAMQSICWPVLLSDRDLIAVTNSNYGKHLAYMLPLIVHIKTQGQDAEQRRVLILTPHQPAKDDICTITKPYLEAAGIKFQTLYESENKEEQVERLKASKFELLVANPSRLLDIYQENEGLLDLNEISFLIVDEYIQFRKMQTMDLVKKCVELLRRDRQTAVFSRLVPSGIQRQGDEFVTNCIFFEMHHDKESADDEVKQYIELCDKHLKTSRLVEIVDKLTRDKDAKMLIYAKDKEKCLNLNFEIKRHLDLDVIDFRKEEHLFAGSTNCIMTTFKNIGLEINILDLHYIINFDFPPNLQTYMDRLRKGVVHYTLFCREDAKHAERLIYSLKQSRQEFNPHLFTMSKAWLECGRDMRFMPMMEDIQKGISKPLQEMNLSSGEEDSVLNSSFGSNRSDTTGGFHAHHHHPHGHEYGRGRMNFGGGENRHAFEDDEDDDDDDDEDDDDALIAQ